MTAPAPVERLTAGERHAYDALKAGDSQPSPAELDLIAALEELARHRDAEVAGPVDVAGRVLERLELELAEPADLDNGLAVAALAVAYDRLKPDGPTHQELAQVELKLADSEAALTEAAHRADELGRAIADVVRAANGLGARSELLLDGVLEPVGQAILSAAAVGGITTIIPRPA